jgi:ubiquinone/menaquinone biosynthesis C-methylase UbiE/uncharacterized protein YbaR (Trm112 family)
VRVEHLVNLRCPRHRDSSLNVHPSSRVRDDEIDDGGLVCSACGAVYPICSGVPAFLPAELEDALYRDAVARLGGAPAGEAAAAANTDGAQMMVREMQARDAESELYDQLYDDDACRFELETYVTRIAAMGGERILDLGCGTGRVAKEYLRDATLVVAVDFSQESLVYFRERLQPDEHRRTMLVRGDAGGLPLPDESFDALVSTSLFSNLPTAEIRLGGLAEAARCARSGAPFLITVYNHCWVKRIRQRLRLSKSGRKEGFHSGGLIHYYNFDAAEFADWISPYFAPDRCFGLNHRVPVISSISPTLTATLDRILFRVPFSLCVFAKEMGMVAHKR